MPKKYRMLAASSLASLLLLVSMFGASFVFAKAQSATGAHANAAPSAKPATIHTVSHHTVNMQQVPVATARSLRGPVRTMPFLTGVSPAVYAQRKAAAAHTTHAPVNTQTQATSGVNTPNPLVKFNGMADSGTICNYFGSGCQPPDQALAASSSWVFQGVNTSWAVYNTSGAIQSGWP